ncbi:hypothetical protein ACJRO7_027262 [Eucalyptus globulus]|uniref:Uncharacterized protein n=1 Tax=Eucalyptus globulus TaxID=34317 RepID=A0ABD3JRG1_EUCGL
MRVEGGRGYSVVPHQVVEVQDDAVIMINYAIAELLSQKLSSRKDSQGQEYKGHVCALLEDNNLVDTSQRLFEDHLFSLEEHNTCLSILLDLSRSFKRLNGASA